MTYPAKKFEVAASIGLGYTYKKRDNGRTDRQTDGRRTDFGTKLIYTIFLKKKAGIKNSDTVFVLYISRSFGLSMTKKVL